MEIAENGAKAGSLTEQAAKKLISEIVERTSGEALHNHTVADWLTESQAGKADAKARTTARRYGQVVREFLESFGNRAKLSLSHITPKDIRAYRDAKLAAGNSTNTANDAVRIVSTAFNAALRQGYITNNPCTALESLPEETAERSTFTAEQVAKLVGEATGDWKGAVLFAYFTGARLGDVANMTWSAVDLEKRLITFAPGKTKRSKKILVIPLHPELERGAFGKARHRQGVSLSFIGGARDGREDWPERSIREGHGSGGHRGENHAPHRERTGQ